MEPTLSAEVVPDCVIRGPLGLSWDFWPALSRRPNQLPPHYSERAALIAERLGMAVEEYLVEAWATSAAYDDPANLPILDVVTRWLVEDSGVLVSARTVGRWLDAWGYYGDIKVVRR